MQSLNVHNVLGFDKYIVDIGAQVGPGPLYHYFKDYGYDGLCIEGDPNSYAQLCQNLPAENIQKVCTFVDPMNIIDIFQDCGVPQSPLAIKIDIDGYDYFVLDKILEKYSPAFVVAEINEKIPPPIEFETLYRPDYAWKGNHLYGFSVQSAVKLMNKHGYTIIQLYGGNNIVCMNNKIPGEHPTQLPIEEIYKRDYLENPILSEFPWNANVHHWTVNPNKDTISDIIDYFILHCGASMRHFNIRMKE